MGIMRDKATPNFSIRSINRRQLVLVTIVFVLSLSVWVINWTRTPELTQETFPVDGRSVLSDLEWEYRDCHPQGGYVVVTGEAPRVYLTGFSGEIQSVAVRLKTELTPLTSFTLRYPNRFGNYGRDAFDMKTVSSGKKEYLFSLPLGEYATLRLDISEDIQIEDILVSPSPMDAQSKVLPPFRFLDLVISFAILLMLAELILYQRHRIVLWLNGLWSNRRTVLKMLAAGAVCVLLSWPVCHFRGIPFLGHHVAFFFIGGVLLSGLWFMRGRAEKYPQQIFALLCLSVGLLFIFASPLTSYITEDGGIHFQHTLSLSYMGDAYVTNAEKIIMNVESFPGYASVGNNNAFIQSVQGSFKTGGTYTFRENILRPSFLGYLPGAIGLWLGRFLGLPFLWTYGLGRFANLLAYTLLVCCAIKRANRGKALLCAVALIPSAVFQAASYSYGPFMIGVAMIAAVLYFNEIQQPDKPITLGKTAVILGLLLVAFLPRPIYFPLMLMMFFIPKTKLPDTILKRRYMLLTALTIIVLLAGLALPILTGRPAATDPRSGLPATVLGHVMNFIDHPAACIKVIVKYIAQYLNPNNANQVLTTLGSFSNLTVQVPGAVIILAVLAFVVLTEPEDSHLPAGPERAVSWYKLGVALGICCTIGVIVTWSYVVFSPVGANTVAGCQGRYLLPLLFPALYILRSPKIRSAFRKGKYLYFVLCPLVCLTGIELWRILRSYR